MNPGSRLADDSRTTLPRRITRDSILAGLLFVISLAAYFPALHGGFLWDDDAHVTRAALRSLDGLRRIWFEIGATQQYYPLLHTAFWVEHRLWGDSVLGYHLVNVVLHVGSACLVVAILRRLLIPGAWLGGFIFALHPVCVESVAWISEQKNTLSAVLCLGSAFIYLGFDGDRRRSSYGWALALFVMALLTKTVTATLPAALLVILCWRHGRLGWKRDVLPLVPWLALGCAAGLFTAWVERTVIIGEDGARFQLNFPERCLLAGRVIWFYAGKLAWPAKLMFIYPKWSVDDASPGQYSHLVAAAAVAVCLAVLALRGKGTLSRTAAGGLAGYLIFAGTLFPALGFFSAYPFLFSYVADHFQYMASLGLIVPLAAGLTLAAGFLLGSGARAAGPAFAAILVAALAILTRRQCAIYANSDTLWRSTIRANPECWMAYHNLGVDAVRAGRVGEAREDFLHTLRLNPDFGEAHNNLGTLLMNKGRLDEAFAEYQKALETEPHNSEINRAAGVALLRLGLPVQAIGYLQKSVERSPGYAEAHNVLGAAYLQTGQTEQAAAEFRATIALNPGYAEAHANLGNALIHLGRIHDAVVEYLRAVEIRPDNPDFHGLLGKALSRMGLASEAEAQFQEERRLRR
jgi:tetratricopeptide (TPR) repeat protein